MSSNSTQTPGEKTDPFLLEKIWCDDHLLDALCEPGQFEPHAALTVARQMMERYQNFDTRLVNELMALPDVTAGKDRRIERCLEILDAVSSGRRIIMPIMPLMKSQNPRVRSKVARILGSRVDNLTWTRKFLGEVDDRTRANIIESLWGNDSPEIRELLWQAVDDGNNRVRGNAILALYHLGVASVLPSIRALSESQTPNCRATAAWLMGASGDPRFRSVLKSLRQDAEATVRAAALRSLVQLNKQEGPAGAVNMEALIYFCEDFEGVRRVGFDLPETGVPQRDVLPTDVVLTENGALVWDYTLVERRSDPLSALFLIFEGAEPGVLPDLKDAFVECLEHKGNNDLWSVARMAAGPEGDFAVLKSVPPPYKGPELNKALARFDELPRVKTDELSQLVRHVESRGPGRHLVLLLTPPALSDADLESLERAALALRFSVDVISFCNTGNEKLQRLARKTDGIFTPAPDGTIAPAWMVQTYASMAHRYEVSYPLSNSGESAFAISILPPRGSGPVKNTG